MLTKIRTAIITLIAASSVASIAPVASQAKPVRKTPRAGCIQKLGVGWTVEYKAGTEITKTGPDGKKSRYRCDNGNWTFLGLESTAESNRPPSQK